MRKIYKYQLVRYYFSERTDEFINVGVIVKDENNNFKVQLLKERDKNKLDKCSFIEKEHLLRYLNILEKNGINKWYQNYLKFSQEKIYESEKSLDEVIEWLYETKVGYKFERKSIKMEKLENIVISQQIAIETLSVVNEAILNILKMKGLNFAKRY